MKTWHKGAIIGGAALAVLIPAGLVAADQMQPGQGHGRGNGSMNQDCDRDEMHERNGSGHGMQARDGTGPMHDPISATTTTVDG